MHFFCLSESNEDIWNNQLTVVLKVLHICMDMERKQTIVMLWSLFISFNILCPFDLLAFKIFLLDVPNQNQVLSTYIYHKICAGTSFSSKKLHKYNVQVWLTVAAFLAFLNLKFSNCSKSGLAHSNEPIHVKKCMKIQF